MSAPSYYYTGAPRCAGIPISSDGCIIDGSHRSDEDLSALILSEAHAYGMPRRLSDSVDWHSLIAERYDERAARARYWQGIVALMPERAQVGWRVSDPDALAGRALDHRWAHSEASEDALNWLNEHSEGASFYVDESCLFVDFVGWAPMDELASEYWVCVDCYMSHHGYDDHLSEDGRTQDGRSPLSEIPQGRDVSDWTDSETGEGMRDFVAYSSCDGCGSALGGARYRLAVWDADTDSYRSYWQSCVAEGADAYALTVESWRDAGRPARWVRFVR